MRLSSRRSTRNTEIELSMTSMIDVVFLLLIFFMVTSSFVQTERDLDSAAKISSAASASEQYLERVEVRVIPRGNSYVYQVGGSEFTDSQRQAMFDTVRAAGGTSADAVVYITAGCPWQMSAAALQACHDANCKTVSYVPLD